MNTGSLESGIADKKMGHEANSQNQLREKFRGPDMGHAWATVGPWKTGLIAYDDRPILGQTAF